MSAEPIFLLAGHDTVECAYYLRTADSTLDFNDLTLQREDLRQAKRIKSRLVNLGGRDFLLRPTGTSSGYSFCMDSPSFTISFGEFNDPSFFVKFISQSLWEEGVDGLNQRFIDWASGVQLFPRQSETLSRVDFTFDFHVPVVDFDEDSFVSLADKDHQHRKNGRVQTFGFGAGDIVLRVYDKVAEIAEQSQKTWFFDLWGQKQGVWRIEWQVRKNALRRFFIRSIADLLDFQGDLLTWLATEHTTLRERTNDSNRSRWPLHPLWRALHRQISSFPRTGLLESFDPKAALDERLTRCGISVYGYLKQIGALESLKRSQSPLTFPDAVQALTELLTKLHDPLTWPVDVRNRINEARLRP